MTPSTVAVAISLVSVCIAATALGWNIYRDVILKARVHVSLAIMEEYSDGVRKPPSLFVTVTNVGPGIVHLEGFTFVDTALSSRIVRNARFWLARPHFDHPASSKLPQALTASQRIHLVFAYERKDSFLGDKHARLGVTDTFGRIHLASKSDHARARRRYLADFGAA